MSARRQVFPDAQSAADACARYIAGKLEQALAARAWGTLAVSGRQHRMSANISPRQRLRDKE